jgi:hypothetical protein
MTPINTTHEGFWFGVYRSRQIATLHHMGAWLVFLDQVIQKNNRFETAEEAVAWLHRRIEALAAEAIFPGLGAV